MIASVNEASTEAFVSNASLRLQHAAFVSSLRLSCWIFNGSSSEIEVVDLSVSTSAA